MNITIIGTGYVGLVSGTCFSEMGNDVTCVDVIKEKVDMLNDGKKLPIYEPGLEELVRKNVASGRLHFTTDLRDSLPNTDIVFCAVGTPPDEDGSADLSYVLAAAKSVGENLDHYLVFTTKSTVPVGTAEKVRNVINEELKKRNANIPFDVASNPEFLKEGDAVNDFMKPDRIVVGVDSDKAKEYMSKLYRTFNTQKNVTIFTNIKSAEMIKYASNSMLATRISFMNEIAQLCEQVGANVDDVRAGMGSDSRIGSKFLYAGCGYGGSCFPKDVKALIRTGRENGVGMRILDAVEDVNYMQKKVLYKKLTDDGVEPGSTVAVLGLAFKPNTDDMREAPSLVLLDQLYKNGYIIHVTDPVAMEEAERIFAIRYGSDVIGTRIIFCNTPEEACNGCDAAVLVTEWKEYRDIDWSKIGKTMNKRVVVDGRNVYNAEEMRKNNFTYNRIG